MVPAKVYNVSKKSCLVDRPGAECLAVYTGFLSVILSAFSHTTSPHLGL